MLGKFERYFTEIMRGARAGIVPSVIRGLLHALSWPYATTMRLRNWGYDKEWLKQYHPPIPVVISVGNIVSGGTGKTPLIMSLAKAFYENAATGILSRGYRSPAENLPVPVTLSAGKGPLHSAAYCGDEPYMLSENLPKAIVYVGKNRHKSANMAAKAGVEIALLDDGMQHRRLGRDFEVVVIDVDDPFGQGYHLPRGFLRESPKGLSRADLVVINHVGSIEGYHSCREQVSKYTPAPMIGTRLTIEGFYDLRGEMVNTLQDKKVGIFCGIANPERFIQTIRGSGAQIVGKEIFPDHAFLNIEQIVKLTNDYKAKGAEMLVCTEKDKVKIPDLPELALPIVWCKMHLEIVENESEWDNFVSKVWQVLVNRTGREANLTKN